MQKWEIFIIVAVLPLTSCLPSNLSITQVPTQTKTQTPTPASTSTQTSTPVKPITATVEATQSQQNEVVATSVGQSDLSLIDENGFEGDYMGVHIVGSIDVDESLEKFAKETKIAEETGVKAVAEIIFRTWMKKSGHNQVPTDQDRIDFMKNWAKAQSTNLTNDWSKVEFSIWANDIRTEGYKQDEYIVRFMNFKGGSTGHIKDITRFTITLVNTTGVENITPTDQIGQGMGTNLFDDHTLSVYTSPATLNYIKPRITKWITEDIASIPGWLLKNRGNESEMDLNHYPTVYDILINGGFRVIAP